MIPEETGVTLTPSVKLIVLAVPTILPSSLIPIPVPEAVIPVSPEPSPTNDEAVKAPDDALNLRLVLDFGV